MLFQMEQTGKDVQLLITTIIFSDYSSPNAIEKKLTGGGSFASDQKFTIATADGVLKTKSGGAVDCYRIFNTY